MKQFYLLIFLVTCLSSCNCYDCKDNLSTYLDSIYYKNGDIAVFENDSMKELRYRVNYEYRKVEDRYCHDGSDADMQKCNGNITINIGRFNSKIIQDINQQKNRIIINSYFNFKSGDINNFKDTITMLNRKEEIIYYNYHDEKLKSTRYYYVGDSLITKNKFIYYEYVVSNDNRLLQYTTIDNGVINEWKLK